MSKNTENVSSEFVEQRKLTRRELLRNSTYAGLGIIAAGSTLTNLNASPQHGAAPASPTPGATPAPQIAPANPLMMNPPRLPVPKNPERVHAVIKPDNLSLVRNRDYCTRCGSCVNYCNRYCTVHGFRSSEGRDSCINCGQCSNLCPTQAITERPNFAEFQAAINDPDKIVIATTSPAVRLSIGEMFGLRPGTFAEGQMVEALKKLGCDYVLDTTFGADLTVMEESAEFVERLKNKPDAEYPLFTSCCPAWVRFAELFAPQVLPHISSTKSPIMMQGATIKTFFAEKNKIDPNKIVTVAITPCTAKKSEIKRAASNTLGSQSGFDGINEIDIALTCRELGYLIRNAKMDFRRLTTAEFDPIMGRGSASGLGFGQSAGVAESVLRTAYFMLNGEKAPAHVTQSTPTGNIQTAWVERVGFGRVPNVRQATVDFKDRQIRVAIVETTGSLRTLLDMIENDGEKFDLVEVMSCIGGCMGGGGQPIPNRMERSFAMKVGSDANKIRDSYENPDIADIYNDFFEKPLSEKSLSLLHYKS
ncbi:MAG: [Fe-Fe] hydrogenase large subunit C-terminal domain-containing protein [Thermoguttaceae bacterium]